MDWMLLATLGFVGAYKALGTPRNLWGMVTWYCLGAMIPLMILGMLSIGPYVLVSLLLLLLASAFLISRDMEWSMLDKVKGLILGFVYNLILLTFFIFLGNVRA